jgi:hypothetical protein
MTQETITTKQAPRVSISIDLQAETHEFKAEYLFAQFEDIANEQNEEGHWYWVVELSQVKVELKRLLQSFMTPKYRVVWSSGHIQKYDGDWGAETLSRVYNARLYADGKFDLSF